MFSEGEQASSFFVLLNGELEVIRTHPIHQQEMIVSRIFDQGESVGEIAAVRKDQHRSATVRAATDSNLVEISYEAIDAIGGRFEFHLATIQLSQQYQLHDEALTRSYPYQLLTSTGPVKGWSHEKTYEDQQVVFSEGDPSELVYFIISGQAKIALRATPGDNYHTIIGQGQIFGELGVINGQARSATVTAHGKLRVLVVDASRFLTLSGANHELSKVLLLLRRIYRNGTGQSVLQFEHQVDGVAVYISSIDLPNNRQLVIQYTVNNLLVTMKTEPDQLASQSIQYKFEDAGRNIRRSLNVTDGQIVAGELEGPNPETGLLIAAIRDQTQLTTEQLDTFSREGLLFTAPLSSDMVCHCLQISQRDLQEKIALGCQTAIQLVNATGAGTVCGGCHGALENLTGEASSVPVRLSQQTEVVPGVHRIRFTTVNSKPLPASRPGQHITVKGIIDGINVSRPYTLTSSQTESRWREITIRKEDHGLFSRWLCSIDHTETSIQISAPQGDFCVDMSDTTPIVMLAAGIGITPALAIARSRAEHQNGPKIHIDHSARTENQLIAKDELSQLAARHSSIDYQPRRSSGGEKLSRVEIQKLHEKSPNARWMIC
ncbi:MAG: cyclic nucleotide-binding domain-containing protein, partial [Planctomycetota bacterium]